jgi:diaminopimelate decarboxylase
MTGCLQLARDEIAEIADRFGTPLFVYDGAALEAGFTELRDALPPQLELFFSLKANPNVSVCSVLRSAGARAEVSSSVELQTALWAGVAPEDIIFLGPGKSTAEIADCVEAGIFAIVAESLDELALIERAAARARRDVAIMLRVNPSFTVKGSALAMGGKPRQFGIDEQVLASDAARAACARLSAARVIGVHAYMGTRILDPAVVSMNTARILALAEKIAAELDFELQAVDVGGGLGVAYFDGEHDPDVELLGRELEPIVTAFHRAHPRTRLMMELGRFLTARAGMYVVRARYVKESLGERFVIADGGTNHHMAAVGINSFVKRNFPVVAVTDRGAPERVSTTLTGPLCTPNDTLAKRVSLPDVRPGDLIGIARSGAYGPSAC